jgi:hypothetical protein
LGGGAFILFKAGDSGPKNAKKAEIRIARVLKTLPIAGQAKANDALWPFEPFRIPGDLQARIEGAHVYD